MLEIFTSFKFQQSIDSILWIQKLNLEIAITFTSVCVTGKSIRSTGSVHPSGAVQLRAHRDSVEASNVPFTALAPAHHHCVEVQRAVQALGLCVQEVCFLLMCFPRNRSAPRRRHSEPPRLSLGIGIEKLFISYSGLYSARTDLVHSLALTKDQFRSYRPFFLGLKINVNTR